MTVPSREEVADWSPEERAHVARLLDTLVDRPAPPPHGPTRRLLVLTVTVAGAVVLFPWVAYLLATLPQKEAGGAWRVAWVGFDVALAVTLGATGWLVWRRRQLAMVGLVVAATLLFCDAWFDVSLSWGTAEQWAAIATAALVELPAAALLTVGALTILRRTSAVVRQLRGLGSRPVRLWQQPVVMLTLEDAGG